MARRALPPWCAVAALATLVVLHVGLAVRTDPPRSTEIDRTWHLATTSGVPGDDFKVAYPILTFGVLRATAEVAPDRSSFGWTFVVTNLLCDLVIAAVILRAWGAGACLVYLLGIALVGKLAFDRTDLPPTLFATLAVVWALRARPLRSGAAITIGGALKVWPFALTWLLLPTRGTRARRVYMASIALTAIAMLLVSFVVVGTAGVGQVLTFGDARGLEVESLPGNVVGLFGSATPRMEEDAWRWGTSTPAVTIALILGVVVLVGWASWTGRRSHRFAPAWIAIVGALLVFTSLLSPQFVIWLLPAAALAWRDGHRLLAALVVTIAGLTRLEFGGIGGHGGFGAILGRDEWGLAFLTVRNVALVIAVAYACWLLVRPIAPRACVRQSVNTMDA